MSRTWWGRRFLEALEQFTDPARLGRGRTYATTGRILSSERTGTAVTAKVRGNTNPYFGVYTEPIYTTTIAMTPIAAQEWKQMVPVLSSKAGFVARLLMNEMPDTIDEAFADAGLHLLPHSRTDFVTRCSCPDWANPCKHVAGVYYLLARDLDRDPFVLFELRGLSREELRAQLEESELGRILAAGLKANEVDVEPVPSYYTRPAVQPAAEMTHRDFWTGQRRLPPLQVPARPAVPALLIRKLGDYPAFWHKDASFITVMEELYERVRTKSPEMK